MLRLNRYIFCSTLLLFLTAYSESTKIHHVSCTAGKGGLFLGSLVRNKLQGFQVCVFFFFSDYYLALFCTFLLGHS